MIEILKSTWLGTRSALSLLQIWKIKNLSGQHHSHSYLLMTKSTSTIGKQELKAIQSMLSHHVWLSNTRRAIYSTFSTRPNLLRTRKKIIWCWWGRSLRASEAPIECSKVVSHSYSARLSFPTTASIVSTLSKIREASRRLKAKREFSSFRQKRRWLLLPRVKTLWRGQATLLFLTQGTSHKAQLLPVPRCCSKTQRTYQVN